MRILYITLEDVSLHKGSVVHIKEVIEGLQRWGHFVGLVAFSSERSEKFDRFYNLKIMPIPLLKLLKMKKQPYIFSSLFLFIYLFKILPKYDFIYARDYHATIIALLPRIFYKKKLIFEVNGLAGEEQKLKSVSFCNQFLSYVINNAEKIATHFCDRIICVTPQIKFYLINKFKCNEMKIEVISNGVNTKKFFPIQDHKLVLEWRKKLEIKPFELVVIFIGNLARWQGIDILIESGIHLLEKRNDVKFLIVGDGVIKEELLKRVETLQNHKENFIFAGMVNHSDVPFLINIAELGVAPFIYKRNQNTGVSPLKIYEYMACGKPVVTARINGLEFIEKEGVGKLFEPGDVVGLSDAMDDLLNNKTKREEMGRKGLELANKQFTWELKIQEIHKTLIKTYKIYGRP